MPRSKAEEHHAMVHLKASIPYNGGWVTVETEYGLTTTDPDKLNERVIALAFDGFTQAEQLMERKLHTTDD